MQQPPYRPGSQVPGAPGRYPQGVPGAPGAPATGPRPPAPAPAPGAFPMPAPRRKPRGALRFVAASCVFSGWATLILSVLFGVGTILMGLASAGSAAATPPTNYYPPVPTPPRGGLGADPRATPTPGNPALPRWGPGRPPRGATRPRNPPQPRRRPRPALPGRQPPGPPPGLHPAADVRQRRVHHRLRHHLLAAVPRAGPGVLRHSGPGRA